MCAMKSSAYLPHLDGLRALAFAYVLLFHFQVFGAKAGYLGVDIFLVLSGFLMTRILQRDISNGTFSMLRFMRRRFWRLYPTLLATAVGTMLVATVLMAPKLLTTTSSSVAAAILFVSNEYFQRTTGYFDIGTQLKPMLHTWSLSLEEQFYIVWPPFLYCVHHYGGKNKHRFPVALLVAMFISFAVAVKFEARVSFAFFSLLPRIFEFAFGGFLSLFYVELSNMVAKGSLQEAVAFVGAFFVNYPVFKPPPTSVPGPSSLMTLCGVAFLILSPSSVISKNILSAPFVRFVGKLSYAGYLVHWPLWVYSLLTAPTAEPSEINKTWMFVLTLVLAYVLHVLVENPFRHNPTRVKAAAIFTTLFATLLLCYVAIQTNGLPSRTVKRYNYLKGTWQYNQFVCKKIPPNHVLFRAMMKQGTRNQFHHPPRACYIGPANPSANPETPLNVSHVLIGSSFAHHLIPAMRLVAQQDGKGYLVLHYESCPLLSDIRRSWPWVRNDCYHENFRRMSFLRTLPPSRLLLADYWTLRFGSGAFGADMLTGRRGAHQYFRSVCRRTGRLGHTATVVGEPPVVGEIRFSGVAGCTALRDIRVRRWGRALFGEDECARNFSVPPEQEYLRKGLVDFFRAGGAPCKFFDQFPSFCDMGKGQCMMSLAENADISAPSGFDRKRMTKASSLLYWEGVHLNILGAWKSSGRLGELLEGERMTGNTSSH